MMGWTTMALLMLATGAALVGFGLSRRLWAFAGAALMLGATGYAWQGSPGYAGHPVVANATPIVVDPAIVDLRGDMFGRFSGEAAFLTTADALTRAGDPGSAARLLNGALISYPANATLWTGYGTAIAIRDDAVSPAARLAFDHAIRLAPRHPGPWFFTGLAYVRANRFAEAQPYWRRALTLTPPNATYRPAVAGRLALLDRYLVLVAEDATARGAAAAR